MEIIRQNYTDFFANLESGDVFIGDDNDVFLKLKRNDNDEWFTAVCLSSGELYHFERSDNVRKVEAKLTIS